MFGKNEIVGQKYFKPVEDTDKLFVTSRFMTLQGEGPYRGEPAFFIRLAKCNLNCSFCDTFFDDGDWMTFDEIEHAINYTIDEFFEKQGLDRPEWAQYWSSEFKKNPTNLMDDIMPSRPAKKMQMVLVMTGGEPMLQKNIGPFLERMSYIFENTQIESNGTIVQQIPNTTTLVVSPKCAEKNGVATKYLAPKHEMLKRADCLKFVMSADPDSPYNEIPEWAHIWRKETGKPIYISPMNIYNTLPQKSKMVRAAQNDITIDQRSTIDEVISFWEPGLLDMKANQRNHEYAAAYCVKHGFTLNLQLHLYASLP